MLEFFDSHTHLDSAEFAEDQAAVIERATTAGVTRILTVGASDGFASASRAIALAEQYPFIWASAGIHPHDAETEFDPERLTKLAQHPRVRAVGETGLDFFRDWSPRDLQEKWFRAQIAIAREVQKPIIIHSREAGAACLNILNEESAADVGGVFHCYAEDAEFAKALRDINFLVSFPGTITFKKAESVREAARGIPLEQILIETDAPYMAPTPHRGKRCETAFVVETAKALAEAKSISLEEVAAATTANAIKFFRIEE
jgi:TatD DNase family protein